MATAKKSTATATTLEKAIKSISADKAKKVTVTKAVKKTPAAKTPAVKKAVVKTASPEALAAVKAVKTTKAKPAVSKKSTTLAPGQKPSKTQEHPDFRPTPIKIANAAPNFMVGEKQSTAQPIEQKKPAIPQFGSPSMHIVPDGAPSNELNDKLRSYGFIIDEVTNINVRGTREMVRLDPRKSPSRSTSKLDFTTICATFNNVVSAAKKAELETTSVNTPSRIFIFDDEMKKKLINTLEDMEKKLNESKAANVSKNVNQAMGEVSMMTKKHDKNVTDMIMQSFGQMKVLPTKYTKIDVKLGLHKSIGAIVSGGCPYWMVEVLDVAGNPTKPMFVLVEISPCAAVLVDIETGWEFASEINIAMCVANENRVLYKKELQDAFLHNYAGFMGDRLATMSNGVAPVKDISPIYNTDPQFFSDEYILKNVLNNVPGADKVDPKNIPEDLKSVITETRGRIAECLSRDLADRFVGFVDNLTSAANNDAIDLIMQSKGK